MRDILNILKNKKLQLVFLFYIFLLLPLLTPFAENYTLLDKLALLGVCLLLFCTISVICVFVSPKTEKIIYSVILILAVIPGSIYLGYLLFAHVMLEQNSVMSLFETNPDETKEFLVNYLNVWVITGVLVYAAIPIIMICKMKPYEPLKAGKYKVLLVSCGVVIFLVIAIGRVSRSVYFINIYRTLISYKLRVNHEIKTIKKRQSEPFEVKTIYNDSIPQTVVIVIGESLTRHHMSLYGYHRNTNPLLGQYPDSTLLVYTDIVSPQVHTIPVIRSVLTMEDPKNSGYFEEKPSLIELFNRAGYDTYFISNQPFSEKCHASYDILLTLAKRKYNFAPEKQYDSITLTALDKILQADTKKNKLILIHLIGNHMAYEFRYPYIFDRFNYKSDGLVADKSFRDKLAKKTIDRYDNSVLYNDSIVNEVIVSLKKHPDNNSMMIYFSDHGEELYDYRNFAGHVYEKASPPMCEIPFVLWMSPLYKNERSNLVFDTMRPYSTKDFIYSISDICGFRYEGFDDTRSLFSAKFKPEERYIGEKKYTDIKARFSDK